MPFNFPFSYPYYSRFSPHRQYPIRSQRINSNPSFPFSSVNDKLNLSNSSDISNVNNTSHSSSQTCSNDDNHNNTENSNHHSNDRNFIEDADEKCIFEIFGLKLFFDDILILCILFFLYNEEVKDYELFLCLILLLIT